MLLRAKRLQLSLHLVEAASQILQVGPNDASLVHQDVQVLFGPLGQISCCGCLGPVDPAVPGPHVLSQPQQLLALLLCFVLQLLALALQGTSPILYVLLTEQVVLDGVVPQKRN